MRPGDFLETRGPVQDGEEMFGAGLGALRLDLRAHLCRRARDELVAADLNAFLRPRRIGRADGLHRRRESRIGRDEGPVAFRHVDLAALGFFRRFGDRHAAADGQMRSVDREAA